MNKTQEVFLAFLLLIGSLLAGNNLAKVFVSVPPPLPVIASNGQLSFTARTDAGAEQSLAEVQGKSLAVVYFFAADCNHCANVLRTRGALLEEASQEGFKPIGVVALGPNFSSGQLSLIRDQFQLPSPVFGDVNDQICTKNAVREFTVFLLDKDGNIYLRQQIQGDLREVLQPEILEKVKTTIATKDENKPPVEDDPFIGSIIEGKKTAYRPLIALLALSILTLTSILLAKTKDSWLPLFAGVNLLVVWLVSGLWLYMPANILVVVAAVLFIAKPKGTSPITFALCFFACICLSRPTYGKLPDAQSIGLQTAFNYLIPQMLVSMLMYEISFAMQRQKYQKQVYMAQPPSPTHYDGKLAVVKVLKAERCDICHQSDLFDIESGYCSRCQQKTI